jgi:hypothetical protein
VAWESLWRSRQLQRSPHEPDAAVDQQERRGCIRMLDAYGQQCDSNDEPKVTVMSFGELRSGRPTRKPSPRPRRTDDPGRMVAALQMLPWVEPPHDHVDDHAGILTVDKYTSEVTTWPLSPPARVRACAIVPAMACQQTQGEGNASQRMTTTRRCSHETPAASKISEGVDKCRKSAYSTPLVLDNGRE